MEEFKMAPQEYEKCVENYFKSLGYQTKVTPHSNDYGVDVFAEKNNEKIAVQVKMFGGASRKINREMVMQLHGSKEFFDCTKAVIATNGEILDNALEVANKLHIEIIKINPEEYSQSGITCNCSKTHIDFDFIWEKYIKSLEGKTLTRANGKKNTILKVDGGGITRITSNGNTQLIKIEIFKKAINHILTDGAITRKWINEEYKDRASSGIVLILSQVPIFEFSNKPSTIKLKNNIRKKY